MNTTDFKTPEPKVYSKEVIRDRTIVVTALKLTLTLFDKLINTLTEDINTKVSITDHSVSFDGVPYLDGKKVIYDFKISAMRFEDGQTSTVRGLCRIFDIANDYVNKNFSDNVKISFNNILYAYRLKSLDLSVDEIEKIYKKLKKTGGDVNKAWYWPYIDIYNPKETIEPRREFLTYLINVLTLDK